MIGQDLPLTNIKNNDLKDVVFGRRSARYLDPDFKISREEIVEIIAETNCCTPSAVNTQPVRFFIVDTDEDKKKLDSIMIGPDKDRTTACSFAVIPCADRKWIEEYDALCDHERDNNPEGYPDELRQMLTAETYRWYGELIEDNGTPLDKSINFQAGQYSMAFMLVCRAHGYGTGFMDDWDPTMLAELFGFDDERFIPEGVIAVGKDMGSHWERSRWNPETRIIWATE